MKLDELERRMQARKKARAKPVSKHGTFGATVNHAEPAYSVIQKLGGVRAVAKYCSITPAAVSRWATVKTATNGKGGDGTIPANHHHTLIQMAKDKRIRLSLKDIET